MNKVISDIEAKLLDIPNNTNICDIVSIMFLMNEVICDIEAKLLDILNNTDICDIVSTMFSFQIRSFLILKQDC